MRGEIEVPGENSQVILRSIGIQLVSIAELGGAVDNHCTTKLVTHQSTFMYYIHSDGLNFI